MLSAPEREALRKEIDRRQRSRIGAKFSDEAFLSLPEAATLLGVKATVLREHVRALGIETRKRAAYTVIPVSELDRLRELRD